MRLVRLETVLGRPAIVAGWLVNQDAEWELVGADGELLRECAIGATGTFPFSARTPPSAVEGVVYSAQIHGGRAPHLRKGGVDGKAVGCLLAADQVATPVPFSVLKWRPLLGNPQLRTPDFPRAEDEYDLDNAVVRSHALVRVEQGWAERAVYSLRPWDAVALWQTPESDTFGSPLGRIGDALGSFPEVPEKLLGVVVNERGRVRFIEADYWETWAGNCLPKWAESAAM